LLGVVVGVGTFGHTLKEHLKLLNEEKKVTDKTTKATEEKTKANKTLTEEIQDLINVSKIYKGELDAEGSGLEQNIRAVTLLQKQLEKTKDKIIEVPADVGAELKDFLAVMQAGGDSAEEAVFALEGLAIAAADTGEARAKAYRIMAAEQLNAIDTIQQMQEEVKRESSILKTGEDRTIALERAVENVARTHGVAKEMVAGLWSKSTVELFKYRDALIETAGIETLAEEFMSAEEIALKRFEKRKPKRGKSDAEGRRRLIFEASLIGMDELHQQLAQIDQEFLKNMKTAGRARDAQLAAHQIAVASIQEVAEESLQSLIALQEEAVATATNLGGSVRQMMLWQTTMGNLTTQVQQGFLQIGAALAVGAEQIREATDTELFIYSLGVLMDDLADSTLRAGMALQETMPTWQQFAQDLSVEMTEGAAATVEAITGIELTVQAAASALEAGKSGLGATLAAGKAATFAFIKDQKKQALILGAFEVAEAARSIANANPVGAVLHGVAAAKYFLVAGTGGSASTAESRSVRQRDEARAPRITQRRKETAQEINQYFFSSLDRRPPGQVVADALNETANNNRGVKVDGRLVSDDSFRGGF
jgi:hypothetical protein